MLIYAHRNSTPLGLNSYKRINNKKSVSIRTTTSKSDTHQRKPPKQKTKKKVKRVVKNTNKKKLNAKNIKFLKKLGFKVKKH